MTDFSDAERRVYETIRMNTGAPQPEWIDLDHLKAHLEDLEGSEVQQAIHNLYRAHVIEVDEGRYRPSDRERRILHPGEVD